MGANLKCLNLAFNEFTFYKNAKGDSLKPPREGFLEKGNSRHKTISLWRQLCRSQIPTKDFMSMHSVNEFTNYFNENLLYISKVIT